MTHLCLYIKSVSLFLLNGVCFFIDFDSLCFLMIVFSLFTYNLVTDMAEFTCHLAICLQFVSSLFFSYSAFPAFFWIISVFLCFPMFILSFYFF